MFVSRRLSRRALSTTAIVKDVPCLAHTPGLGSADLPARESATILRRPFTSRLLQPVPDPRTRGTERSTITTSPVGLTHSGTVRSGKSRRMTWSTVQVTVATVGIPRRR